MAPKIITNRLTALTPSLFQGGAPGDLASLADVKLELDLTTNKNDAWLKRIITRVSKIAAHYCNRDFRPALFENRIWPELDPYPWQTPPRLSSLQLSQFPISSTVSVAGTAPPQAPTLSAVSGGSLPASTLYVRISYVTESGETAGSLESFLALAASTLLCVEAPGPDVPGLATGWNVYAGSASFAETKQNQTPIGLNSSWTMPSSGLVSGDAVPSFVLVVENSPLAPTPLCEGVDFVANARNGQLERLFSIDRQPKNWNLPVIAIFQAPFCEVPEDLQDAIITLVKARWFARKRDPLIRGQTFEGVYSEQYFSEQGSGMIGDLPPAVREILDRYRVPVMA